MPESKFDFESFFSSLEKKRNYKQLTEIVKSQKEAGFDLEEILALAEGHFDKKVIPLVKLWINRIWREIQEDTEETDSKS